VKNQHNFLLISSLIYVHYLQDFVLTQNQAWKQYRYTQKNRD